VVNLDVVLPVVVFLSIFFGRAGKRDDGIDVVDIETDEERDVLLELECAVERGEGGQALDGVEGGYTRASQRALEDVCCSHDGKRRLHKTVG
jgi:hypothetical protein